MEQKLQYPKADKYPDLYYVVSLKPEVISQKPEEETLL
jgi:hypothetical protein